MEKFTTIECPECGHNFEAADAFKKHLEEKEQNLIREHQLKLKELQEKEEEIATTVQSEVEKQKESLRNEIQLEVSREMDDELSVYKEELRKKKEEVRDLKKKELEIEELKEKLLNQKEDLEIAYRRKMLQEINEAKKEAQLQAEEELSLKLREKEEVIEAQKRQVLEMKRKIDQGSMQLQGEALELMIEEKLKELYPGDEITEIKKGVNGADVIQNVIEKDRACGSILYETKNTQNFSGNWVDKLRSDQQEKGASVAVLITRNMPKDEKREFYFDQGVIICNTRVFPIVSALCRKKLVDLCHQSQRFEIQKDTMGLLYQYLTSDEFQMHIEEMVQSVISVKDQIATERRAFERQWKERDKQADRMMSNLTQMFGSIKGIAPSVKEVKPLELLN